MKPPRGGYYGRYGDGPIDDEFRQNMQAIAGVLDEQFNGEAKGKDRKVGFVLMVFPYGDGEGRANYISNGVSRETIIELFRAQADRFEQTLKGERG